MGCILCGLFENFGGGLILIITYFVIVYLWYLWYLCYLGMKYVVYVIYIYLVDILVLIVAGGGGIVSVSVGAKGSVVLCCVVLLCKG